jgi:hypothetical protein
VNWSEWRFNLAADAFAEALEQQPARGRGGHQEFQQYKMSLLKLIMKEDE